MPNTRMQRVYLTDEAARFWRGLAVDLDVFTRRGVGAGEFGNASALLEMAADAMPDQRGALLEVLAAILDGRNRTG